MASPRLSLGPHHLYWPQKTGWQQRRTGSVKLLRREGVLPGGVGLLIADQSIDPEIGHRDRDEVVTRFHRAGHVDAERRLPDDSERLAVDRHLRQVLHISEIEPQPGARLEPIRWCLDGLRVYSLA